MSKQPTTPTRRLPMPTPADIAEWEDLCDLDPITEDDIQALFGPDAEDPSEEK